MDMFSIALGYVLQAIGAVFEWFGRLVNALGPTTYGVLLALFLFAAVMSLIVIPLRGAAISDMTATTYTKLQKGSSARASGHMGWFGGRKGKYSK